MAKNHSFLRSVTLTVLAILFATLTANAATHYSYTITKSWNKAATGDKGYTAGVVGEYIFRIEKKAKASSAADGPQVWWITNGSTSESNGGYAYGADGYSLGNIVSDEAGHLVIAKPIKGYNYLPRAFYAYSPSGTPKTTLSGSSNMKKSYLINSGDYANYNVDTNKSCYGIRVNGDMLCSGTSFLSGTTNKTASIWVCPKELSYIYEIVISGSKIDAVKKYTTGLAGQSTWANASRYASGKILYYNDEHYYDVTLGSSSFSSSTEITATDFNAGGGAGAVMFMLSGRKILVGATSESGKTIGFWDVTDGVTAAKARKIGSFNVYSSTVSPKYWLTFVKSSSTEVHVFEYCKEKGGVKYIIKDPTVTSVAKPTISGTTPFNNSTNVTIKLPTLPSGADYTYTVRYTTDGSTPTTSSGTPITANKTIPVSATTTVKAIAYITGYTGNKSDIASKTFTKNDAAANVTYSPNGGTFYNATNVTLTSSSGSYVYYGINANPSSSYVTSGGSITIDGGTNGQVVIKAIGKAGTTDYSDGTQNSSSTYTFKCGTPTITGAANGGSYVADSKTVTIAAPSSNATTGATYQYSTDGTNWTTGTSCTVSGLGSHTVYARAIKTNYQNSGTYSITFTLRKPAAPTISGTSPFDNSTTVTMAAGADGGTIYYTSGSSTPADPTTSSTPYTSGIDISSTTYFKAICVVNGVASDVTSATFTRNEALAAPTIMPTSNTYNNDLTATITAASGATIYYRVNGGAWQTYSSGISVTADNTTIEAYAVKSGNSDSPIASQTYNFTCLTPTASPAAGIYNSVQSVTLSCGTTGATIHYTTDGSTPNSSSPVYSSAINVSTSMTIKAIAIKSGYTDSDVLTAEYVLNLNPSSNVTSPVLTSTPKYGTSVNNPDRDLARLDGNLTFSAADPTSNGWTLDKYVVTISDGTNYATTVSGANINAIEFGTESTTITACNFKVGSTYTATVFARYKKGEATYDMPVVSSDAVDFSFDTYSPTIAVTTYVTPRQSQYVWWEDEHEQHQCYFDSYRVELTIDDDLRYSPTNSVPVSYYELLVSKDKGKNWEVITDRTVNNLLDPTNYPATTYPEGQYSGVVDKDKYVGRYNGNYRFSDSKNKITMDAGTENEREINLWFYYVYDVTSKVGTLSITDDSQGDPSKWQYRINAVYGGSKSVTVDGTTITPTTDNISTTDYSDAIQSEGSIIITGVDGVTVDRNVKEIRFFDMRGVRLNEAPSSGFYIEVKLMNDGSIRTNKRVAR